ncbi:FtsK/SpoIIIE domain-containing protein [Plantibacter sp. T3]|uniref:FtsK/SpoIIIE domain-containing protein n=1 Tax=Plantibacter sp. T3 TaxID=2653161 RepID=UPI0012F12A58|nr:FtsK/SpoIIIE domain-containing protein [Plantibacter sp. T3]VXB80995.1 FHA domain-containing protein [Plantibacter sp. T3]
MRIKLTLTRPSGSSADIVVTTDAAASIAEVASTIARVDPQGPDSANADFTLHARLPGSTETLPLPPEAPIGEAWVGSGAVIELADAGVYYSAARTGQAPAVAVVRVLSGDDAGREFTLPAGSWTIGREASCDIVLDDPLVSKRHARLEVGGEIELVDLGAANGIVVDGGIVPRLKVIEPERVLIGDTEVEIGFAGTVGRAGVVPKAGPVYFNRSPRVEQRYAGETFPAPEPPTERENQPFPLLGMLTPMLLGGAMYFFTKNPLSLIFIAMTPLMLIGNYFTGRGRNKRKLKQQIKIFDERLESLGKQLAAEREIEHDVRMREAPSTSEALKHALTRGPLLWTRRPEHWSFLNLRLGVGTMPSRNEVSAKARDSFLPEFQERLEKLKDQYATVADVPIIDNLYDAGALGIAGSPQTAGGAVNGILVQLTALHSPAEVVVSAIVSPAWSNALSWVKWLPHASSPNSPLDVGHLADSVSSGNLLLAAIEELVQTRLQAARAGDARRGAISEKQAAQERGAEIGTKSSNDTGTKSPIPAIVLLISDDVGVDRARLVQLAEIAADAGVFPIWIADDVVSLPAACRTFLQVPEAGAGVDAPATVGMVRLGYSVDDARPEFVDPVTALDYARRMASVIDAGALVEDSSDLPRSVSMVTLLGPELTTSSDAVVDRWRQNSSIHDRTPGLPPKPRRAGQLRATVGSGGVDAMHLDLRAQGPHALVGGTTGAGKSEFLQAWVLGMAAEYSPDRVSFLFVDYKGGSAFADCVTLPHCVGLVTDLSPHLVRRALTSLRAELHFREHLLNRKKAKDLLELEKRGDPDSPPALVLVIDEFAALVGEVPEFVDGVVDIAQRGRSLGIHLIMATQRPAGVIKDNLRANTNLRVALRMADESDSQDVVGVKDAAHFDPGVPGRGIAKTGPGRLSIFQSGYAGGWTSDEPKRSDIEVRELRFGGETRWEEPRAADAEEERDLGPTDQQRLVASIIAAADRASIPAPRRPWLDELAPVYDLSKLRQRSDAELLIGVADLPDSQEQRPVYFRPDVDGHIAVFGTGGSGKSTVLRTLATAAGITPRGGPVEVYGLDFGAGSLRMLEALPHVGSIIPGDDQERVIRLLRRIKEIVDERSVRYAEANASSITDYRRVSGRNDERRILLLVDGFQSFRQEYETTLGLSSWYTLFQQLITDGRQLGVNIAFSADRPGSVPTNISSGVQRRVVLRLADETGYQLLGVPKDILGPESPAGRAIVDGLEVQVAILGGSPVLSDQSVATVRLAEAMSRAGATITAPPIGALPKEIEARELPERVGDRPVLGIGDADLAPIGFDPSGAFLVGGPPGSGRTNAVASLVGAMRRFDPATRFVYFGSKRSELLRELRFDESAVTPETIAEQAKALSAAIAAETVTGRTVVVIETLSDYLNGIADPPLVELIKAIKRSDHLVIAENEVSGWSSSWPLMGEIKSARRGILLQPEQMEGDLVLRTTFPRLARKDFPQGRGIYANRGALSRVQLPIAPEFPVA